jgi:3',5'-cyclic AMP phosphodiesterase CpdA
VSRRAFLQRSRGEAMTRRILVLAAVLFGACSSGSGCGARPLAGDPGSASATTPDAAVAEAPLEAGARPDAAPTRSAAPAVASGLVVAAIADINSAYGSTTYTEPVHAAVRRILELRPDLVLGVGDMTAGQRAGVDSAAMWAGFRAAVGDPLDAAGIPLAVTPGNHDASGYAEFEGERAVFVEEWSHHRPAGVEMLDDARYPLRYAFTMGPALFVSLDATETGPMAREQLDWLRVQLEAGASRPAKIVFGHLPIRPVAVGRENDWIGGDELEALLEDSGVDVYLSGHHHAYYPSRRGSLREIALGSLAGPRALIGTDRPSPRTLVLLRIGRAGDVVVEPYTGPRFDEPIDVSTLPALVGTGDTAAHLDVLR